MSDYTAKQSLFAKNFCELVLEAIDIGYQVSLRDGYRGPTCNKLVGGHPESLHLDSMAHDLLLRDKHGELLDDYAYNLLHDIWERKGGNKRIKGDLGHFSWPHNGMI